MRTLAITRTLLVAAALAAPADAARARGVASAAVGYWQNDQWTPEGAHDRVPRLDVALELQLDGYVVSRDVFRYAAGASWRTVQQSLNGAKTQDDTLLMYNVSASALDNTASPVRIALFASRGQTTFASDPSRDLFGDTISQTAGANLSLLPGPTLIPLNAGYIWNHTDFALPGQPESFVELHTVNAGTSFGNTAFGLNAAYSGTFSDGSYVADQTARHEVSVGADMSAGGKGLRLESMVYIVQPRQLVPGAFEQQTSSFHSGYGAGGYGDTHRAQYSYAHALIETPEVPAREATRQSVRYEGDHFLTSPTLFTRFTLDGSLAQDRNGGVEARYSGETLGAQLWWRRVGSAATYAVHAGPVVSLMQSEGGDARGYGGAGGVQLSRPLWNHTFTFGWDASYADNSYASAGWSLTQTLTATLSGTAGRMRFNGVVSGYAFRTYQPLLGEGAGRSFDATFDGAIQRFSFRLEGSLQQGITGSTPQKFVADGLLVPAPFDSRNVTVAGTAATTVLSGLTASATVRYGSQDTPGRPVMNQLEAVGALSYAYGGLTFIVDERITRYQRPAGTWDTVNFFGVRVARAFGW